MDVSDSEGSNRKDGPLSPEEEAALWLRCREGDDEARERIVLAYRPLVFWLSKKFYVAPSSFQDLIQEGMMALLRAVDNFDPEKGARFVTYAYYRVRGCMTNFLERVEAKAPLPLEECEPVHDIEERADQLDWLLTLQEGMRLLPEREAEVVDALVLKGRKAREIADERGVDVSYIYRIQRKALARFRSWLGGVEATNRS